MRKKEIVMETDRDRDRKRERWREMERISSMHLTSIAHLRVDIPHHSHHRTKQNTPTRNQTPRQRHRNPRSSVPLYDGLVVKRAAPKRASYFHAPSGFLAYRWGSDFSRFEDISTVLYRRHESSWIEEQSGKRRKRMNAGKIRKGGRIDEVRSRSA
jgi:hypothetical protein